jgi:hypothetical protein
MLIFGSLPFSNLASANFTWPNSLWLVGFLALAAGGIVAAVIAVSLVSEPEDASLGELELQLRSVQAVTSIGEFEFADAMPKFTGGKLLLLRKLWNPRRCARMAYCQILHGREASAHLGPRLRQNSDEGPTITHLIKRLGDLEAKRAEKSPMVAKFSVVVGNDKQYKDELLTLLGELRTRRAELKDANATESERTQLEQRLADVSRQYDDASVKLSNSRSGLAAEKEQFAEIEGALALYRHHRTLGLVESSVMQLRGTFRLARRILALAALLTLVGGAGYGILLPKSDGKAAAAASTVLVRDRQQTLADRQ